MRSLLAACLAALACAFLAAPASAAPINYNIFGSCNANCASVGLQRGFTAFGTLTIDREPLVLGGPIQTSNLTSYSFTFGSNTISSSNDVGASLVGVWANDLDTIAAIDLRASTAVGPASGLGLVLMLGGAIISTNASCPTAACDAVSFNSSATLSNLTITALGASPLPPAPIPLPPALGLVLAGTGALGLVRRVRRRA
jgi:hypothetical protein